MVFKKTNRPNVKRFEVWERGGYSCSYYRQNKYQDGVTQKEISIQCRAEVRALPA